MLPFQWPELLRLSSSSCWCSSVQSKMSFLLLVCFHLLLPLCFLFVVLLVARPKYVLLRLGQQKHLLMIDCWVNKWKHLLLFYFIAVLCCLFLCCLFVVFLLARPKYVLLRLGQQKQLLMIGCSVSVYFYFLLYRCPLLPRCCQTYFLWLSALQLVLTFSHGACCLFVVFLVARPKYVLLRLGQQKQLLMIGCSVSSQLWKCAHSSTHILWSITKR